MVKSVYFGQKFINNFLSTQIESDFRFALQITLLRVIGTNEVCTALKSSKNYVRNLAKVNIIAPLVPLEDSL
jgi:hypothetical protein